MLASLRFPAFRWLWFSNLSGSAGRWALVLILGAQLLQLTHSSFWVGAGLFLTQGPVVVLAPLSGVLADRFDRRALNAGSAALSALTTGLFALLSWTGLLSLPMTLALCVLFGVSFALQMTLRSALVPSLVPAENLLNAVSLSQVALQGAQFIGPALATPLLVLGGPPLAWTFCSVLYAVSALLCLPIGEVRPIASSTPHGYGVASSFRYLAARPLALTAICAVAIHCSLTMAYQGMLPMFVSMDLGAGSSTYGALLASIGLGAVVGSLALARFDGQRYRPALFVSSLIGSGVSLSAMAATQSGQVAVVSGFFVGSTQAMFMSMTLALIQSSVEDHFRGRATSAYQMITLTPMAVLGWGMGGLADIAEPRPVMVVSGIAFEAAMVVYALFSPSLRSLLGRQGWQQGASHLKPLTLPS